ncbi:peptide/nickel transport system ATP-binding protein [Thermomonospora echinospora]|uniref:Peptide/nickel transport system ATP-binding protein n=1 Tax=Thermomonospora echinospora TaxID=1992 RepID=A0A1H5XAD3_9ACTN|nr:ABC transporter ATP-binding protein [Thermomonospora echinospora]SEG08603.1 peptide/nickel transport system ATP-binding protein [Thermomonospora echinospora]
MTAPPLLRVEELSVRFRLREMVVRAVTDVSFELRPGRLLALVGESGCGKSVLASTVLGLLPGNAEIRGSVRLYGNSARGGASSPSSASGPPDGLELLTASERTLARHVRGRRIALVPQSAATALTPVRTARSQLVETLRELRPDIGDRHREADRLAGRVGLEPAALDRYPHELSGGMAQRVVLALALAADPDVIIADEPTSGLDRPLVERTVDTLRELAGDGRAVLLITHDIAAAERVATDLAVMYASRIVEQGPASEVFDDPWHPYTRGLLEATPARGFRPLPGHPPSLSALPPGCAFRPRCSQRDTCTGDPALVPVAPGRALSCARLPEEGRGARGPLTGSEPIGERSC